MYSGLYQIYFSVAFADVYGMVYKQKKLEPFNSSFMELMTGFEPVTSSLPRMRSTD